METQSCSSSSQYELFTNACLRSDQAAMCAAPPFLLYTTFAWEKLYAANNTYDYGAIRR
jgi:hypothetical protein